MAEKHIFSVHVTIYVQAWSDVAAAKAVAGMMRTFQNNTLSVPRVVVALGATIVDHPEEIIAVMSRDD